MCLMVSSREVKPEASSTGRSKWRASDRTSTERRYSAQSNNSPRGESMGAIFQSLGRTVAAGVVLLVIIVLLAGNIQFGHAWGAFFMRWLHVLSGVMWIGLLWYFNFVQIPSMPKIPDEQKPAISKVIAPAALFWFRWAALATLVTGALLATMKNYIFQARTLQKPFTAIGIGLSVGINMWFNVWFII